MDHIEEHILELYSLGSPKVESRRHAIDAHLAVCASCRRIASEMAEIYRDAQVEWEKRANTGTSDGWALVPVAQGRHIVRNEYPLPLRVKMSFVRASFVSTLRRHPVAATIGGFALGAAMVAGLVVSANPAIIDPNPSYVFLNLDQSLIEVRNKENQKLWDLPSLNLKADARSDESHRISRIVVCELDGDGKNDVVTVAKVGDDQESRYLRAFGPKQNPLFTQDFLREFQYRDRSYSPRFVPNSVLVLRVGENKNPDIFVATTHMGHSPSFVARFDGIGNEIGEYWHFGNFLGMYQVDVDADGKKKLILIGTNDAGDTSEVEIAQKFPFAVVLNPEKIRGQKKSVSSKEFSMSESDAEEYYIRIPLSNLDSLLHMSTSPWKFFQREDGLLAVDLKSGLADEDLKGDVEYTFDQHLVLQRVGVTDATRSLYERLLGEKRIVRILDDAYLGNLKEGVRYWDGRGWSKERTRIVHEAGK